MFCFCSELIRFIVHCWVILGKCWNSPGLRDLDYSIQYTSLNILDSCNKTDHEYEGHNIEDFNEVETWLQCSKLCRKNKQCKVWVWGSTTAGTGYNRMCWLKAEPTKGKTGHHLVSGTRQCGRATGKSESECVHLYSNIQQETQLLISLRIYHYYLFIYSWFNISIRTLHIRSIPGEGYGIWRSEH